LAKAKNWIYTSLAEDDALELILDGVTYKAVRFVANFAVNEMPTAQVTLAIGRDARTNEAAKITENAPQLNSMKPAKVMFHAKGDFDSEETKWPGSLEIFDGYFTGFSHKKIYGKVHVVASLIHWLADLGFSSTLNAALHQANPSVLISPAVLPEKAGEAGGTARYLPTQIGHGSIAGDVDSDLWVAMKKFLCNLAQWRFLTLRIDSCGGSGEKTKNDRALKALKRIEGESKDECDFPRDVSKPLPLDTGGQLLVNDAVATALTNATMESFANQTFWDVLIKNYFPSFGMALVPLIDRAVPIALTPGWRGADGQAWKIIETGEYVATEQHSLLPKPMRGIGVYSAVESDRGPDVDGSSPAAGLGACFLSDAEEDADGSVQYINAPAWLHKVASEGAYAGNHCGNKEQTPIRTATSGLVDIPLPSDPAPRTLFRTVANLMQNYAQTVYVQEALRGRSAIISGKLRFDISPGSHILVKGSPEEFLQGVDKLAADTFAFVQRTSIAIDAEAASAMTTFNLLYNRNEKENQQERTSVAEHPLFGGNIMRGAALLKELDLNPE
jgi:hypothetical protein